MKILIALAVITAMVAAYVVWIRPWLRERPWAQGFFAWIDPIEIALWKKSETILFARFKMVVGVLLAALTMFGEIDLTPLMPLVPDAWEPMVRVAFNLLPLTLTLLGWIDEKLRKDTTKPLEVVALPVDKPPELAAAVERVEIANRSAEFAVAVAKADGAL